MFIQKGKKTNIQIPNLYFSVEYVERHHDRQIDVLASILDSKWLCVEAIVSVIYSPNAQRIIRTDIRSCTIHLARHYLLANDWQLFKQENPSSNTSKNIC
jgi:hypothetical protein